MLKCVNLEVVSANIMLNCKVYFQVGFFVFFALSLYSQLQIVFLL